MSNPTPAPDAGVDRRGFARRALTALGALFAALFGIPAAATVADPALRASEGRWVPAGRADDVKDGAALRFTYEVRSGWETRRRAGYLVRAGAEGEDGAEIVGFDARCTHLGCTVRAQDGEFRCPCHGGRFSLEGEPTHSPVTEPLRRFETRVRDGAVEVRV